jgi:hypothetical protein
MRDGGNENRAIPGESGNARVGVDRKSRQPVIIINRGRAVALVRKREIDI